MNNINNDNSNDKYSNEVFSNNLRHYLQKSNMTQIELAKRIGVAQGTISDWLNCRSYPRMNKVEAISMVFDIEKSDLIEDKSANNKYFLEREISKISVDLRNHPASMQLYMQIKKLSPYDRETVSRFIDSLAKGVK